jgi:protein involved in plasmid replication-relaxation
MVKSAPTRADLQPRDLRLIHALAEQFRLLTRQQIEELLGMRTKRTLNVRLMKLHRAGYLSVRTLARMGNARRIAYYLGPAAVELLDHPTDRRLAIDTRSRAAQLKGSSLKHRMLVDSIHIRFLTAARHYPEYKLLMWIDQYSPWWQDIEQYGVPVQADGYCEYLLLMHFDTLSTFFLEVDCGEETGSDLQDKIDRYVQYALSGQYEQQFAAKRFRVLFAMSSEVRLRNTARLMENAPPNLFWLTTSERFMAAKLFDDYWHLPGDDRLHSLMSHQ